MPWYGVTSTFRCSCGNLSETKTAVDSGDAEDTQPRRYSIAKLFPERSEITCNKCHKPFLDDKSDVEINIRVQIGTIEELRNWGFDV